MKVKDKLEVFSQSAITEAIDKRDKLRREIDKEYESACKKIRMDAEKESEEIIREELYKTEQHKNREIIRASTEAKKSYLDLRNQLINEMFDEVLNKVYDYIETDEYTGAIKAGIMAFCEQHDGEIEVYLCERDYIALKNDLEQIDKIELFMAKDEIIGGFLAKIKGKNILYDNSYAENLNDAKKSFSKFNVE